MNSPLGEFLRPEGFVGPRGLRALARETSSVAEAARLVRRSREERHADAPYAGHQRPLPVDPVLLVPGFMAGDATLRLMGRFLRQHGFRTYRSHIHVNVGCTQEAADRLERRIESIAIRRGRKVTLVGHSLGGMLSRGLAGRRPDLVEGIITMGSPILAPAAVHATLAWDVELLTRLTRAGFGGLMSEDCVAGACARASYDDTRAPLPEDFSFTAIYSRRDGIVDWRACLDPDARHVEVRTSHVGMAVDPVVLDHVLGALREQQLSRASRQAVSNAGVDLRPVADR